MHSFLEDLRYAARQLRNAPAFTLTAVLTLALGIGATSAIFSAVYGLLLKSLPFADEERIVTVAESLPQVKGGIEATFPDYEDWQTQQQSFTAIAAYSTRNPETVSMAVNGHSEQVHRVLASGNFFSLLGVTPLLGRTITQADDQPGSDHVAVLSAALWHRIFNSDPEALGRNIDLNGASYTIVGVLSPGAAFPSEGEVWLPLSLLDQPTRASRVWHSVHVLGRLRSGVSLDAARANMQAIAASLSAAYPATNRNVSIVMSPLRQQLVGTLRPALLSLLGAVFLVLAIACANVASLLMVRATAGRREVAVRQALGAGRARLFSQSLAQTLLLCLLGGLLGTALAALALPLLRVALAHTAGLDVSLIQSVSLNIPVLLFTLAACTLTAILFGLLPRFQSSGSLIDSLRAGDRGSTGGNRLSRGALVTTEIAITVVVLFLAMLVIRSYQKLVAVDPGFPTDHLLSAEITLPEPRYTDLTPQTAQFYTQLLDRLAQSPGVVSVSTTTQTPLKPSQVATRFLIDGAPQPAPGAFPAAQLRYISPSFFQTMGLHLLEGRVFGQKDLALDAPNNVIGNAAFARLYLAGRNPLGAHVLLGVLSPHPDKNEVIGIVSDARDLGVDTDPQPELYFPGYGVHAVLLVRSQVSAESMVPAVRDAIHALEPNLPIYNAQTLDALLSDTLARQRMTAVLLGIFAVAGLLLAGIGIYGVLSYSIAQRTREIGLRMAVGANRGDILRLVLKQTGAFVVVGFFAGLALAFAGARLIGGLLYKTTPLDPLSAGITVCSLASIAALAVILPAGRAASVNPTEALRAE